MGQYQIKIKQFRTYQGSNLIKFLI